jgi:hypothetical protein
MFLWCGCHCERTGSSVAAVSSGLISQSTSLVSQSEDSQVPPIIPSVGCPVCRYSIAPAVYELDWNYTGQAVKQYPPRPCCPSYTTQKKYRLYSRVSLPNECVWSSNESIRGRRLVNKPFPQLPAWECQDVSGARVVLKMARSGQPLATLIVYYGEGYPPAFPFGLRFSPTYAYYVLVDDAGVVVPTPPANAPPGQQLACLRTLRFRAGWAIDRRPALWVGSQTWRGEPFGSPCDQDSFSMIDSGLPEYVTCTPVAA